MFWLKNHTSVKIKEMKTNTPKVKCLGNKKDGFVLSLHNPQDNFKWDVAVTELELEMIANVILKKLK